MSRSGASAGAVIAAAGSGSRMDGVDKLFAQLAGRPLLAHALAPFQASPAVRRIALVLAEASLERGRELVADYSFHKVSALCAGGPRRQDSVRLGLEALGPCDWVLVHDGARPLVDGELIARGLEAAEETGAAVPALPIADTVKEADADRLVQRTLDRSRLWAAQTPQVFRYDLLARAHRDVNAGPSTSLRAGYTDDASMLEALGLPVRLFAGSARNIKVTTREDLRAAEALLREAASPADRHP